MGDQCPKAPARPCRNRPNREPGRLWSLDHSLSLDVHDEHHTTTGPAFGDAAGGLILAFRSSGRHHPKRDNSLVRRAILVLIAVAISAATEWARNRSSDPAATR